MDNESLKDKRGKQICPKCGYHLLARKNDEKIFCLSCDWETEIKRKDDLDIPEINETADLWHGV
jgi:ssDNA-binding Zn-finger/Zn-ribbon topoisomerase 1